MRANPLCEDCVISDRSTISTEVHHVAPVESAPNESGMSRLMFSYANLRSLCHACHAEIHRRMFSQSKESVQANNKRATQRFADKYLKLSDNDE